MALATARNDDQAISAVDTIMADSSGAHTAAQAATSYTEMPANPDELDAHAVRVIDPDENEVEEESFFSASGGAPSPWSIDSENLE